MEELRTIAQKLYAYEPQLYPEDVWDETLEIRIGRIRFSDELLGEETMPCVLALKSGLHLWNQSLDASHAISQDIHTATGSYWHGIMHRMEGDYGNAKYWFRRVGAHPVFSGLQQQAGTYLREQLRQPERRSSRVVALLEQMAASDKWLPDTMIDCVELQVTSVHDDWADSVLRRLQWMELVTLLNRCWEMTFGGSLFHAE